MKPQEWRWIWTSTLQLVRCKQDGDCVIKCEQESLVLLVLIKIKEEEFK